MSTLHQLAREGNVAVASVLISEIPAQHRVPHLRLLDNAGYSAQDLARAGGFSDFVALLGRFGGGGPAVRSSAPRVPAELFPAREDSRRANAGAASAQLEDMGWGRPEDDAATVPDMWMPPPGEDCWADAIDLESFDFDIFCAHYLARGRPLLVRRGAAANADIVRRYRKEHLISKAGNRLVQSFPFPYADQVVGESASISTLGEYVSFLDERKKHDPSVALNYVFLQIHANDTELDFVHVLPNILADKVASMSPPQFYLGGTLMGSHMHFHTAAVNSLFSGRKLWILRPPVFREWGNEAPYAKLVKTSGMPEAHRCVQEAGDLLFVPADWSHSTLCIGLCVGAAHENLEPLPGVPCR